VNDTQAQSENAQEIFHQAPIAMSFPSFSITDSGSTANARRELNNTVFQSATPSQGEETGVACDDGTLGCKSEAEES
jgi:hypothetical protein